MGFLGVVVEVVVGVAETVSRGGLPQRSPSCWNRVRACWQ